MAERRMFAKTIVTSDAFLDMPPTARCLYFLLAMLADDDGFMNAPNSAIRQSGATIDDMKLLIAKRYILTFESGVVVIKHWRIHNLIKSDRYKETVYLKEKNQLVLDENKAYTEVVSKMEPQWFQDVSKMEPQDRLGQDSSGKDRLGEESVEAGENSAPSLEDIITYVSENDLNVNAQKFYEYYNKTGWQTTKGNTFDWREKVKEWSTSERNTTPKNTKSSNPFYDLLKNGETYE